MMQLLIPSFKVESQCLELTIQYCDNIILFFIVNVSSIERVTARLSDRREQF